MSLRPFIELQKKAELIRCHKHKSQVKRDLRAVRAKMRVFEKIQSDLKELSDIPYYYPNKGKSVVGRRTYNDSSKLAEDSDVEAAHPLTEDEFYDIV